MTNIFEGKFAWCIYTFRWSCVGFDCILPLGRAWVVPRSFPLTWKAPHGIGWTESSKYLCPIQAWHLASNSCIKIRRILLRHTTCTPSLSLSLTHTHTHTHTHIEGTSRRARLQWKCVHATHTGSGRKQVREVLLSRGSKLSLHS